MTNLYWAATPFNGHVPLNEGSTVFFLWENFFLPKGARDLLRFSPTFGYTWKKVVFGTKSIFFCNNNNYHKSIIIIIRKNLPESLETIFLQSFITLTILYLEMSDHNKTHVIIAKLPFFVVAVTRFHYRVKNK